MAKKRAYSYTRVSTSMQIEGFSLDAQKQRIESYAKSLDIDIIREFSDEGKSGKSIEGREEFQRMLEYVKAGEDVDYIIVYKLSRFGRNTRDILDTFELIQDYGVDLICVEDGIDSSKGIGKVIITILGALAELERDNIAVQTMEGRKEKALQGRWNWRSMSELEQKKFFRRYIERVELFEDFDRKERAVKKIVFKFPLRFATSDYTKGDLVPHKNAKLIEKDGEMIYDRWEYVGDSVMANEIRWDKEGHVETVVLMSQEGENLETNGVLKEL